MLYIVNVIAQISIISDKKGRIFASQPAVQCRHASCSFRLSRFSIRVRLGVVRGQPDQCEIVKGGQVSGSKKKKKALLSTNL